MSRVRVVVPVHQRPEWLAVCLRSLELQDHPDFDVTVVDDASPDPRVSAIAREHAERHGWRAVRCEVRSEAMGSRCAGIEAADPADDEIIVFVDGDDWLTHAGALRAVDQAIDDEVWMTSGGMAAVATDPAWGARARALGDQLAEGRRAFERDRHAIVAAAAYRRLPWCHSHPLAFRAFLWRHIDPADFRLSSGAWIRSGSDLAVLFPLLELAGGRVAMLDEVHYIYSLHAGKAAVDPRRVRALAMTRRLLASRRPYERLERAPG